MGHGYFFVFSEVLHTPGVYPNSGAPVDGGEFDTLIGFSGGEDQNNGLVFFSSPVLAPVTPSPTGTGVTGSC